MEFNTAGHIFPRTVEEAATLSAAFKAELRKRGSIDPLVEWLVTDRKCISISDELRDAISDAVADEFGISTNNVAIVGSARLGFSIAEKTKKGVTYPRYRPFVETSDIDVAIIDGDLFDEIWKGTFLAHIRSRSYFSESVFAQYMFKGWFRPDKLPFKFPQRNRWFDFFTKVSEPIHLSNMKVSGGLYKSKEFLAEYQRLAFVKCLSELNLEGGA